MQYVKYKPPKITSNKLHTKLYQTFLSSVSKSPNFPGLCYLLYYLYFLQESKAYMMQQFSAKTFSLNLFHTLTYPFFFFIPFRLKNVWLRGYHYSNQSLTVVSLPLNIHFIWRSLHIPRASISRYTGNLHLAAVCMCCGNRNETPVCAVGGFFFLNNYQAARHTKAAEWKCLLVE